MVATTRSLPLAAQWQHARHEHLAPEASVEARGPFIGSGAWTDLSSGPNVFWILQRSALNFNWREDPITEGEGLDLRVREDWTWFPDNPKRIDRGFHGRRPGFYKRFKNGAAAAPPILSLTKA